MVSSPSSSWQESFLAAAGTRDDTVLPEPRSASRILPRLYLSNFYFAHNAKHLRSEGITHVVSVIEHPPDYPPFLKGSLHLPLADSFHADILKHLDATTEFIKSALEEHPDNKVLVHCLMGISRSATVVCAYLIATTPMNSVESVDFVIGKRPIVCPNIGFRGQLDTYSERFPGKNPNPTRRGKPRFPGARASPAIVARIKELMGQSSEHDTKEAKSKNVTSVAASTFSSMESVGAETQEVSLKARSDEK